MADYGSLPFLQQIAFFRSKVSVPTRSWSDIYAQQHDQAFMVAGATKDELLGDLRTAVDQVVAQGMSFEQFKSSFRDIAKQHGWAYNGGENWRAQVIYETNLNQSYNAGREAQMADPRLRKFRPYGLYKHYHSEHERPTHAANDGLVVALDDPWWNTWSPQNGWGCKCKKFMVGDRDVARMGLKVSPGPEIQYHDVVIGKRSGNAQTVRVPVGIDPGFEYRPGSRPLAGLTPTERNDAAGGLMRHVVGQNTRPPLDPLPPPRHFDAARKLPPAPGMSDEHYVQTFLDEFGAGMDRPVVFKDAAGAALPISQELFRNRHFGSLKVTKNGREEWLRLLADTIRNPDEIVLAIVQVGKRQMVRRRYIARWETDGEARPGFAVFDYGVDGWTETTTFAPDDLAYLEQMREGFRLYRRQK